MKHFIVLVGLVLAVAGCHPNGDSSSNTPTNPKKDVASQITYVIDKRTNLCYAYAWDGSDAGGPIFTNVPCTPAVLELGK